MAQTREGGIQLAPEQGNGRESAETMGRMVKAITMVKVVKEGSWQLELDRGR